MRFIKRGMECIRTWSLLILLILGAFVISISLFLLMISFTDYAAASFGAIAASLFMIFLTKINHEKTSYKNLYGAYMIAAICGYIGTILAGGSKISGIIALLVSIILMLITKIVHAPAVGLAWAAVIQKFSVGTLGGIILCIFGLIAVGKGLRYLTSNPNRFLINTAKDKIRFRFKKKDTSPIMLMPRKTNDDARWFTD